jgi:hypothetical protein
MSQATLSPHQSATEPITSRLAVLRRQVSTWFWVDGLSRVLSFALALFAVDLAIDWMFRLDWPQRVVMLGLIVAAVGWLAYRRLVKPLSAVLADDALALQVEAGNKQLGQAMITAMQLAQLPDAEAKGMSPQLVRHAVRAGVERADRVDFGKVLDEREFRLNCVLLTLALAVCGLLVYGIATSESLNIWFHRNILLDAVSVKAWPQDTYLVIERAEDGRVVFPRGEDWTQLVTVTEESKVIPEVVHIDFRRARNRPSQAMKKSGERQFEAVFSSVIEPFEFRARGGDAVTDWVQVELVEQPAVETLKLVVTPPQYAGQPPAELPAGKGPYYLLPGSMLRIEGTANKELVSAALVTSGERLLADDDGKFAPVEEESHTLALDAGTAFQGEIGADKLTAGQYTFRLEDTLGLTGRRPVTFATRRRVDREPRVRVRLVGISSMIVPKARIPFTSRITDDFAVTGANLDYLWTGDGAAIPDGKGSLPIEVAADLLGEPDLAFDEMLEVEPLAVPTGVTLRFTVKATDNDDISGPNVGASPELAVRVVTEEELRTDLLRREKEQRQEFERLTKNQDDLLTDCRALLAGIKETADLTPQQKDQLMQYQKRQKLVGQNTAAIAERFALIVIEVQNNRLEEDGGRLQMRLENDIILPMQEVSGPLIDGVSQQLDRTRRQAAAPVDRDAALTEAIAQQEAILARMNEILTHMVKSEGFQEAVNLLYEIQKMQTDVHIQTDKERQERIKKILEGAGTPSEK